MRSISESNFKKQYNVDDSIFDYEGAQKVGMDFIGVTYGFGFREGESYDFPTYHALEAITTILA